MRDLNAETVSVKLREYEQQKEEIEVKIYDLKRRCTHKKQDGTNAAGRIAPVSCDWQCSGCDVWID
jgi:hypothetical protein